MCSGLIGGIWEILKIVVSLVYVTEPWSFDIWLEGTDNIITIYIIVSLHCIITTGGSSTTYSQAAYDKGITAHASTLYMHYHDIENAMNVTLNIQ